MRIVYIDIDTLRPDHTGNGCRCCRTPVSTPHQSAPSPVATAAGGSWQVSTRSTTAASADPMMKIIEEGGPFHTRGKLPDYTDYFKRIDRPYISERMLKKFGENPAYYA